MKINFVGFHKFQFKIMWNPDIVNSYIARGSAAVVVVLVLQHSFKNCSMTFNYLAHNCW